jgi:hypothetical protein
MPRSFLSFDVLRVIPGEVLLVADIDDVCAEGTHGIGCRVPTSVPKRGPRAIIRQPTPAKLPIKNGPEIVDFRPVL